MAEYDLWAPYYDLVFTGLEGEAEFYVGQALKRGGPVLELGAGTGRIALPIAMSGVQVTAVDNSRAMLGVLRDRAKAVKIPRGVLTVVEDDMRRLGKVDGAFPLILMAYRTFMHLLTPADQQDCLRAVRDRLEPGGLFILNLWAPKPTRIAALAGQAGVLNHGGTYAIPGTDRRLVHQCAARYDEFEQRLSEEHFLYDVKPGGAVASLTTLPLERRWTYPGEMAQLVRAAGFETVALMGGFDAEPFDPLSSEMIWALARTA